MPTAKPRQPFICIATGQTGVGKTFRSAREVEAYVGRGRSVLIFDVNEEEEWGKYRSLDFDVEQENEERATAGVRAFSRQTKAEVRRVVPRTKRNKGMDLEQLARTCELLLRHFQGGLLILEDINRYITSTRAQAFVSGLCTNRHRKQDVMIHLQSLRAVDSRLWQNLTWIRFHHQVDDVALYQDRIPDFTLVKVAQLIVNQAYNTGNKRFFLYVNPRENCLRGATVAQFEAAARTFLNSNTKLLAPFLAEEDDQGRKLYANRNVAISAWIQEHRWYLETP